MGIAGAASALDQVDGWYQISTAQNLVDFSNIVNNTDNHAKGRLMNDINMSSVSNFTPIGLYTDGDGAKTTFFGEFEGNGYVVKNLNVVIANYEVGMFSRVWEGSVRNLGCQPLG